ncbi:MAG: hypothetical protein EAX95_16325, partial [Candidatus Thorarchaeota archaeon]|nr:hypothetical protein [Candidatus Thorarchaeota archaeon]
MALSIQQLRYPFSSEARDALFKVARDVKSLIDQLEDPMNHDIVRQAEERVYSSIVQDEIQLPNHNNPTSILVYQAARLIVERIDEPRLKEYQAEAESKSVNKYLANESDSYLIHLCESTFGWAVESTGTEAQRTKMPLLLRSFDFRIRFEDFLEVAPLFHAWNWKLIN